MGIEAQGLLDFFARAIVVKEFGALLRREGIHEAVFAEWKECCHSFRGGPTPRVRGWVTLATSSGHRVQFVAPIDTRLLVVYEVEVPLSGDPKATTLEPPAEASAEAALQFRARKTVMPRAFGVCAKRYNLVVLPGAILGERGHLVYALAATTQPTRPSSVVTTAFSSEDWPPTTNSSIIGRPRRYAVRLS